MPLTLRVRHRGGNTTISNVPDGATVADLQKLIAAATGMASEQQILKCGVPPMQLSSELGDAVTLAEVGICNRDTVLVEERGQASSSSTGGCGASSTSTVRKRTCDGSDDADPRASDVLAAFDRAIAAAVKHAAMLPEDKHQVWAMRQGKAAVVESIKRGDNIALSALHTLKGVKHWVVEQVREHLSEQGESAEGRKGSGKRSAPAATPTSFQWWYLGRNGKPVVFRNDAEMSISPGGAIFRVYILHATGRLEKGWLPDAKAPPEGPKAPPEAALADGSSLAGRKRQRS